jgi:hypothetical protein
MIMVEPRVESKGFSMVVNWGATKDATKAASWGNKSADRKADSKDECSVFYLDWKRAAQKAARWDAYSAGAKARRTAETRAASMDGHWAG